MCYTLSLLEPLSTGRITWLLGWVVLGKDNLDVGLDGVTGVGSSGTQPVPYWNQWEPVQFINEVLMAPQPNPCAVSDRISCVPGSL